jgi:hypothetical protein
MITNARRTIEIEFQLLVQSIYSIATNTPQTSPSNNLIEHCIAFLRGFSHITKEDTAIFFIIIPKY